MSLIKDGNMFNLSISGVFKLDGFLWVNLDNTIFYGILNLCQHIITIAVNYLNKLTHFTT